jgi:hypothetical protein
LFNRKKNGITYITAKGEDALSVFYTSDKQDDAKMLNTDKQPENEEILFLREQTRLLHEELNTERVHSRAQADKLADLAFQLAELSRNNQVLLGAEQSRTNPALLDGNEPPPEEKKKGFFSSLFRR